MRLGIPFGEEYLFEVDKRLSGDFFVTRLINLPNGNSLFAEANRISFEKRPFSEHISREEMEKISEVLFDVELERKLNGKSLGIDDIEEEAACRLANIPYTEDKGKMEDFLDKNLDAELRFYDFYEKVRFVNNLLHGGISEEPPKYVLTRSKGERSGKGKIIGLSLAILLTGSALGYFNFVYLPEQKKEPYKRVGGTDKQASDFIKVFPEQNGNSTWVDLFKVWVKNPELTELSFQKFKDLNITLAFLSFSTLNGYDGLNFLKDFPQLAENYQIALPIYSKNSSLTKIVYDQFQKDFRINEKRDELFLKALKEYQDLNLIDKNLTIQTIHALNNLTLAYEQGLPRLDRETVWLLTNATQLSEDIADFSPIILYSVDGNNYVVKADVPRDIWILAEHLKRIEESGFNIKEHPELFEGINCKVIANAYSLFDAKYGIGYAEKEKSGRIIKPMDSDVWELMMLQWNLYSNKAPQFGGGGKLYNRDFQWYNSTQLKELYPEKNTRRQALFFLFFIPNTTFDMEKKERVYGIEGAKTALIQGEKEYETISRLYPNGTIKNWLGDVDVRWYYYDWLEDRGVHGLENTHMQYVGLKPMELWNVMISHPLDFWNYLKDYKGIDQYLTKNWKYWDLVKFIAGYERWNVGNYPPAIEEDGDNYLIPQTLQAFGFPVYFVHINPTPKGAAQYEWVFSLPDHVATGMKSEFGEIILIGPANGFGLYLTKDGIVKDGIKELRGFVGETTFYQAKDGTVKSNTLLAPEIEVYLMKKD